MMITTLVKDATNQLKASSSPRLDAEILLAHVLQLSRSYLRTWPEHLISVEQQQAFQLLLERRIHGEPIAYLIGHREFWSLPLSISKDTLIPRPETEGLVEMALALANEHSSWQIADLGTGSGAIALALASERPNWQVLASDIDKASLDLAQQNAQQLALTNIEFIQSDWFAAITPRLFDLIISNPPYIAAHDPHLSQGDVRFEPRRTLVAAEEGLQALRHIISQATAYLKKGAWLMVEHGHTQSEAVQAIFKQQGYVNIQVANDYAGIARFVGAQYKLATSFHS